MLLIEPHELKDGRVARVAGVRARHLREELRVTVGHVLRIGLLNGPHGRGTVQAVSEDVIDVQCEWDAASPPNVAAIDLILALPRPKVMKRLWAQLAMLGVRRIAVVNAENVERCYFDSHVLSPTFYRPLLIEGLQQAQNTHLPEVRIEKRLKVFVEDALDNWAPQTTRLLADPNAESTLNDCMATPSDSAVLAVGPETGWTDYERELLARHGFRAFSLGRRTLRTDTACIALLALLRARLAPARPLD